MPIDSKQSAGSIIPFKFRFPVRQVDEREIEMMVPRGPDGAQILSDEFVEQHRLSSAECLQAELEVLRSIAIIR